MGRREREWRPLGVCDLLEVRNDLDEPQYVGGAVRYWHGGKRGLSVGMFILPPTVTKTRMTLGHFMSEAEKKIGGYRSDRVYVGTDEQVALLYAAARPDGGWIYEVLPEGELEHDPDCDTPGLSLSCGRAKIIGVTVPDARMLREIQRAILGRVRP